MIQKVVTNNGYLSPYFKLSRGIRQGCPISALLFLLVVEVTNYFKKIKQGLNFMC